MKLATYLTLLSFTAAQLRTMLAVPLVTSQLFEVLQALSIINMIIIDLEARPRSKVRKVVQKWTKAVSAQIRRRRAVSSKQSLATCNKVHDGYRTLGSPVVFVSKPRIHEVGQARMEALNYQARQLQTYGKFVRKIC